MVDKPKECKHEYQVSIERDGCNWWVCDNCQKPIEANNTQSIVRFY